ncbi:hypothetical protein JHD49_08610 [Sulfurimonas sp. SAG-AH-194-C21]|nr:hypothetical protein [Sulfurimonas sp. SAG-AH-194-C21]MDF1883997.1 hypothetical protein [Sulfurimonas sp. SAG-AH-194-C21]
MKIFITFFLMVVLILSLSLEVDELAIQLQDEAFNRALVSFGLAKGLNAVISLLQGTQLSFTPVGVGLNFSVGEILDPFNDMVERFSWIMLVATVSIGIQKIVLTLSATLFMQTALLISVSISLFLLWSKSIKFHALATFVTKSFLLLLLLRFSAIIFIYTISFMHTNVLALEYMQASEVVENTKIQLDKLNKEKQTLVKAQKKDGFFSGLSSKYSAVLEKLNISQQLQSLESSIDKASNNIITLITIFIVETVLMPLLYFWFLLTSIKYIFRFKFDIHLKKLLYNRIN